MSDAKNIVGILKELLELEKGATAGPFILEDKPIKICKIVGPASNTIADMRYSNGRADSAFFVALRNNFPAIAHALLDREEKLKIAVEELKRIEDMKCIQHMPSCSDFATNALTKIRLLP